jgi:hypothetical protein
MTDPRFSRIARFGSDNFVFKVEDEEETITFIGYYNWKENSSGYEIVFLEYFPKSDRYHQDIVNYVESLLGV